MKIVDLNIGFLTPYSFESEDLGRTALNHIRALLPKALPDRYGNTEPFKYRFSDGGIDGAVRYWSHPFLWKKSRPQVAGDFRFGLGCRHFSHHLYLRSSEWDFSVCMRYLREMSLFLKVDIAYLHVFCREELDLRERYSRIFPFRRGLFTTDLVVGIPDLTSVMVFGPPYIELFSREKILTSPGASVEKLDSDLLMVDVVDNPEEPVKDFSVFDHHRDRIKKHLGLSAFIDVGGDEPLVVPEFSFSSVPGET